MPNLVQHQPFTPDEAARLKEEFDKGDSSFLRIKAGKNKVRILPALIGKKLFVLVHEHYCEGYGKFVCSWYQHKEPCFVCDRVKQLERSMNQKDQLIAKEWRAKRRYYANAVDRSNPEEGPRIWGFGPMIYEALLEIAKDEDAGGDFTRVDGSGFDLIIMKSGEKKDTSYTVMADRKPSPLGNEEWIGQQEDLDYLTTAKTTAEVEAAFAAGPKQQGQGGGKPQQQAPRARSADVDTREGTLDDDDAS